jgi:putative hydrolase of the HAD superfamily
MTHVRYSAVVQALLMDVDGVLLTGRPDDGQHWQSRLEDDLGVSPEALHRVFFMPHWGRIVVGEADMMPLLSHALAEIAPQCDPETLIDYWFRHDARLMQPLLTLMSDVRALGVPVYLATNQEPLRTAYLMETLELSTHCDGIFSSAHIGAAKPQARFFAAVQQAVALPAEHMLLVDDSVSNVHAARAAGWRSLHWCSSDPDTGVRALRTILVESTRASLGEQTTPGDAGTSGDTARPAF